MTREELQDKMKDLPNPPLRVNLIQQVYDIMNEENDELREELHRQVLLRDEDRKKGKEWYNKMEELEAENIRLKKDSDENQDLATIAYMQGAGKYKTKLDEAMEIIRDLYDIIPASMTDYAEEPMERARKFFKE